LPRRNVESFFSVSAHIAVASSSDISD
jgi:hypothetical protein